jgi:GTP-binding protein
MKEAETNVAMRVRESEARGDEFIVSGRGLLHLSILLENMRREGYELQVGKPQVIFKEVDGRTLEPIEDLVIETPNASVGSVMELVGNRRANCVKMESGDVMTHLEFTIPARGLIGLRTRLLNASAGQAIIHHTFRDYEPHRGTIPSRINGVLVSTETGKATAHAIEGLQERSDLFVSPMDLVYEGQIVGENRRENDMTVNITREKKLTNVRSATAEAKVVIKQPRDMTMELALEYIDDDELVEITPSAVRLRKVYLKEADRRRLDRQKG